MLRSLAPCGALALFSSVLIGGCSAEPQGPRPNIVLVVFDTLRADRLAFHGHDAESAPFLDELAQRGVVFERAWSTSSWTVPAMASLFTSVYPNQHNCWTGLNDLAVRRSGTGSATTEKLPQELETVASFLQSQGYRTYGISDNPNLCEELGFRRGFDRLRTFDYGGAESVGLALDRFLGEIRTQGPWFVFLHYMDPHEPYHRRSPWVRPVEGEGALERDLAAYDSEIAYADQALRQVFEKLEVGPGSFVLVTADHGEEFLDHGGRSHGFQLYSELTHVPLVVLHPGVDPVRRRVPHNVSLVDILPTLRDVLGSPPSGQDQGQSLVPYYTTDEPPGQRALFAMRSGFRGKKHAVISGNYKLIRTEGRTEPELYDLEHDPRERENVAAEHPDVVRTLDQSWVDFDSSARRWQARAQVDLSAEQIRLLERLGYGGAEVHTPR